MPVTVSYPGVYIEELQSGVRTIVGVPTSITAFVGRVRRGPVNDPVRIQDYGSFERLFGGLWEKTTLGHSVSHFFLNGGSDALIVRVAHPDAAAATQTAPIAGTNGGVLTLRAASPGEWGNQLRVRVTHPAGPPPPPGVFTLTIRDTATRDEETFRSLSVDPAHPRFVDRVLEQQSRFVRVVTRPAPLVVAGQQVNRPTAHAAVPPGDDPFGPTAPAGSYETFTGGLDGSDIDDADVTGTEGGKTGVYALEKADLFNLLCIPPLTPGETGNQVGNGTWAKALEYCERRRAMLLVDAPVDWSSVAVAGALLSNFDNLRRPNAAIFFPAIKAPDPLKENRLETFAPAGAVAGVFARTDTQRGVWKAPAGRDAGLAGVQELTVKMTDKENGLLNPVGVNCLRTFPLAGSVVWGSRTLRGADELVDQWKYIPVRRLALYLEETLYRNTQWVVFEPNDEPLWSQIRLNIGAFMQDLFRKGAFQGRTPREAYLVKCDKETTPQYDIDRGVVNILVGFAPLKPAEFVVIQIQQLAGNAQA